MAALTDFAENKLIDFLFRGGTLTPPATWYIGLLTVTPSDSAAGTEVTGGSYARQGVAAGTTTWANTQASGTGASSGTSGTTSNSAAVTFPAPTANWGTVVAVGLYDASTGGNLWAFAAQSPNKTINNGDAAPSFAIGAFTFQIDN